MGLALRRPGGRRAVSALTALLCVGGVSIFAFPAVTDFIGAQHQRHVSINFNSPQFKQQFLNGSVLGSDFTRYKTPAMLNLDYTPTFTTELLRKDFDLGLAAARVAEAPMLVASTAYQRIQEAVTSGYRDTDFAALLELQARGAGIDLKPEGGAA